jgi:protein-disulfide isomerase
MYLGSGKVRFVYRDFPFLGPESLLAVEAAESAADQGRYWDFRELLWRRQRGENLGAFKSENLKAFAAELGLDTKTFNASLDQGKYRSWALSQAQEGKAQGIKATPTFFINGREISGVPTMDAMKSLIDQELAGKP